MPALRLKLSITLVLLLPLLSHAQSCATICKNSTRNCNICFQNCDNFTFVSCKSGRNEDLVQSACVSRCCAVDGSITAFTARIAETCTADKVSDDSGNFMQLLGYYAIVVIGGIAGAILLVIVVREIYKRCCAEQLRRADRRIRPSPAQQESRLEIDVQGSMNNIAENIDNEVNNFPAHGVEIMQDPSNVCCICLDGDINCLIKCGHAFHVNCLVAWANRKDTCPLCISKQIYFTQVFCRGCFGLKANLDIRRNKSYNYGLEVCEKCAVRDRQGQESKV